MSPIPHFLVIPFPILGHVNPLMQFSQVLVKHGCKVTFLSTEFSQKRTMAASSCSEQHNNNNNKNSINIVTLPDGLSDEDDRNDLIEFYHSLKTTMSEKLPKLIEDVNKDNGIEESKISCIVVSVNMGWALEVGHILGIKGAVMCPPSATSMASLYCIQRLIDDGVINSETGKTCFLINLFSCSIQLRFYSKVFLLIEHNKEVLIKG
ncbi:hypothetical protein K1719_034700 [Acacia pycnantha]|nr:hypothetical protein K1719_034700 [Acacia pycnantha]